MPSSRDRKPTSWLTTKGALRVPRVIVAFWVLKGMSTAMGEATSDFMVHTIDPAVAVLLGFCGLVVALVFQFRKAHYDAWAYWLAVAMVGVFGTMAADVLHVALGVPYQFSTALYAVVLASVFFAWQRTEKTLSFHTINTPRREGFYWIAVMATFAMGTALGDFTAYTLHLGYFPSAILFAGLIAIPAIGYRFFRWNAVFSFWAAYVMTRPLGASIADGLGKPKHVSGMGLGEGWVALAFALAMFVMVAYLAVTRRDVQQVPAAEEERT